MLKNHLDRETMLSINEEQLLSECGIKNRIHRLKIFQGIKVERGECDFRFLQKYWTSFSCITLFTKNGNYLEYYFLIS